MTLPPLPTEIELSSEQDERAIYGYTAEQMKAYGQQCREAALEEAAALCNGEQWRNEGKVSVAYIKAFNEGCADCEEVIRRLI